MTISADRITFEGNTAWLVVQFGKAAVPGHAWEELDRPCEWCQRHLSSGAWPNCPECNGTGRHTFEIEVPFTHVEMGCTRNEVEEVGGIWPTHTHRVSIVPGMVLEIVDEQRVIWGTINMPANCITVGYERATLHIGSVSTSVTLPPTAKPGMWAVQLNIQPKDQQ